MFLTFILITALVGIPLAYNYNGTGLSGYTDSFTLTLAKFTIGNLSNADQITYLYLTICDILSMIALFAFYLHWRIFVNDLIEEENKDHSVVNPSTYALSVSGFDKATPNIEDNLKAHIDGLYRGAYEVEIIYDYNRNFSKFIDYDVAIEDVEKEKQILKQTDKDNEDLLEYEKELENIEEEISKISSEF